jgi:hypothetical protein
VLLRLVSPIMTITGLFIKRSPNILYLVPLATERKSPIASSLDKSPTIKDLNLPRCFFLRHERMVWGFDAGVLEDGRIINQRVLFVR